MYAMNVYRKRYVILLTVQLACTQLARRRVPEMGRPRSKYAFTRIENEIRALAGPDKIHYLISTLLVRYPHIICNRTLEIKISYSLSDSNPLTYIYYLDK